MKEMIRLGLILAAYAVISCFLLAVVNNFTEPVIVARQEKKVNDGLLVVFPDADNFTAVTDYSQNASSSVTVDKMFLAKKNNVVTGAVLQVTGPTYDSATILMGIDKSQVVTGIKFIKHTDTKGYGMKASDPSYKISTGETFYDQFKGKNALEGFVPGKTFEAVSGATITSKGVAQILETGSYTAGIYLSQKYGGIAPANAPAADTPPKVFSFEDAVSDIVQAANPENVTLVDVPAGVAVDPVSAIVKNRSIDKEVLVKEGDSVIGAAVQVSGITYGQDGGSVVTVVDKNRTILGARITFLNDTPDRGQNTAKESFYSQFTGKPADGDLLHGQAYDAVTGASITSDCVADMIKIGAYEAVSIMDKNGGKTTASDMTNYKLNDNFLEE